jgi:hypothetical protein
MSATREFTEDELRALARSPREEVSDAVTAAGDVAAVVAKLTGRYEGVRVGLRTWVATILAFIQESGGVAALTDALTAEARFLQESSLPPAGDAAEVTAAAAAGRPDDALAAWDVIEGNERAHHDWWVDRVALLLSHVYRTQGVDGLETCLRTTGRDFLLPWMPFDIQHDARRRLRVWTETMKGNCGTIASIEEDDEKFSIALDPCGSCGRQVSERPYPGPYDLAFVTEDCPITFGNGGWPVYRTHVPVIHHLIPMEQRGVPWPVMYCPDHTSGGPCTTFLYKDPDNPAAVDLMRANPRRSIAD